MDYKLLLLGVMGIVFLLSRISSCSGSKKTISPRKFYKKSEPEEIPLVDGLSEMTSKDLVTEVLIKMGCQPFVREDDNIVVDIMGRTFIFAFYQKEYWIRISQPYWFRSNSSNYVINLVYQAMNITNTDFGPKIISDAVQNDHLLSSVYDCVFPPAFTVDELEDYLKYIINSFFALTESFRQNYRYISGMNVDIN